MFHGQKLVNKLAHYPLLPQPVITKQHGLN